MIICVGGEDDKVVLRSVEMFDPDTCRWKPLACLPFAISKHGMVSSGTYMYDMCQVTRFWYLLHNCKVTLNTCFHTQLESAVAH